MIEFKNISKSYGNQEVEKYREDLPYNPANNYSYSKMITEYLGKRYKDNLEIVTIRPFNIIGVGQSENFLIPKLVEHFANKKENLKITEEEFSKLYGKENIEFEKEEVLPLVKNFIDTNGYERLQQAVLTTGKKNREEAVDSLEEELMEKFIQ